MTKVLFTPAAERDVVDIWLNVALESPIAADRLVDQIHDRALQLIGFPELGPENPEISNGMRFLTSGRYLILYRIANAHMEIVRVLHGARDLSLL
jgi:toxin ParE1/3/4